MSSPEYSTVRECFPNLIAAFKANLLPISARLFSVHLISQARHKEMNNLLIAEYSRASSLVDAVTTKVLENPQHYHKLIEIFETEDPQFYKDILTKLRNVFKSYRNPSGESFPDGGACAASGSQQTSVESVEHKTKKALSVSSPVDLEPNLELIRRKRVEHLTNLSDSVQNSSTASNQSLTPAHQTDSTSISTEEVNDLSVPPNSREHMGFKVEAHVKLFWNGKPQYGVIKYIGEVPGLAECAVGIAMENVVDGGISGTYNGKTYFTCLKGHGVLLRQQACVLEEDDRESKTSSQLHKQTSYEVLLPKLSIRESQNASSSSAQGESIATTEVHMSLLRKLISDPSFLKMFEELRENQGYTRQKSSLNEGTSNACLLEFYLPKDRAGLVIGSKGKNVKKLEEETKTNIKLLTHKSFAENVKIAIRGNTEEDCKRALILILNKLDEQVRRLSMSKTEVLSISNRDKTSRVIGKRGCNKKAIQKLSGARLKIDETDTDPDAERKCEITGTAEQIEYAKDLITQAILGKDIARDVTSAESFVKFVSNLGVELL